MRRSIVLITCASVLACEPSDDGIRPGGAGTGGTAGATGNGPAVAPSAGCDPDFLGPFCADDRIIGFDAPTPTEPTLDQVRAYSLAAVNALRARTCLPALQSDPCLDRIGEAARSANNGHGYFIANCMNAAHQFGRSCECNWTQENIGAAAGSRRTWVDGVHIPLCGMMTEPKGVGHRSNIEHPKWTRMGVGISWNRSGASWFHEFGCDANLPGCPK